METNKNETTENEKMAGKYLNPKADLIFKLVFGEHADLMMSLLNALLPLDSDGQITSLEYATPEMVPENPSKKNSIVDARCTDQKGRQFIVEMQLHWNEEFKQRVIFNASKAVVKQLKKGEDYTLIQPVYSLNFINEGIFQPDTDEFYHDYAMVNVEHSDRIIEGLRFVFVELPKFKPQSIAEKKMAVLWLRFLTEISEATEEAPAELLENEDTRKALSIVEKSAMSESQLYAYKQFWDAVVNERVLIRGGFKMGMEKGEAIGLVKGEAIGLAKGEAIGIAKGETKANRKNALNFKKLGVDLETISKATGLTIKEIEELNDTDLTSLTDSH